MDPPLEWYKLCFEFEYYIYLREAIWRINNLIHIWRANCHAKLTVSGKYVLVDVKIKHGAIVLILVYLQYTTIKLFMSNILALT